MSATHKIAHTVLREPQEVATLHRAGVWAVHLDNPDPCGEVGGSAKYCTYVVTHTPTGARVPWSPNTKEEAVAVADALNAAHPAFGVDAPWGKPPPIAGLVPSIDEICVNAMSPRARSVWGEP